MTSRPPDSTPQFNQPLVAALLAGRRSRRSAKLVILRLPAPRAAVCAAGHQRYTQCDPALPCAACVRAQRAWAASGAATAPGTAATATFSSGFSNTAPQPQTTAPACRAPPPQQRAARCERLGVSRCLLWLRNAGTGSSPGLEVEPACSHKLPCSTSAPRTKRAL